jgi:hypothetical protein
MITECGLFRLSPEGAEVRDCVSGLRGDRHAVDHAHRAEAAGQLGLDRRQAGRVRVGVADDLEPGIAQRGDERGQDRVGRAARHRHERERTPAGSFSPSW